MTHGDPIPTEFYDNLKSCMEGIVKKSFIFLRKTMVFGSAKYPYRVPIPMLQEIGTLPKSPGPRARAQWSRAQGSRTIGPWLTHKAGQQLEV